MSMEDNMMKKKSKELSKKELSFLRNLLTEQKKELIFKNVYLSDDFNLDSEDRSDEVDQANADVSNAQRLRFRNRESFYEKKIEQTFRKIEDGTYGYCEGCEEPIGFKRLCARPVAEQCIMCKEESERDESASFIGRKSKSLGAQINLVNHG
jgi:DnaK suppressor protein